MFLNFGLIENHLTDDPGDYMAIVQNNQTYTVPDIIDRMISRGSTVTKAEAFSVYEEMGLAVEDILKSGGNINTPLFCVYPSIAGVFQGENDNFDRNRHAIRLNFTAGSRLSKIADEIKPKKGAVTSPTPVIEKFVNLKTKAVNETFTPGQIASISGLMLKFNEEDPTQGIFFIAPDNTEVKVTNISKNKPSELMFFVPDQLTSGTYQVEVRAILKSRKSLSNGRLMVNLVPVA